MAKKIGELLVETGVITPDQLRAALRAQLQRGGHLGTCLIELKFVDENVLGHALAQIHRCEHATADQFSFVSQSVIERIPTRVAERRRAVPINIQHNALRVAMVNPGDLTALDELAFSSGLNICPCVAPEVRIVQALERYYGIPRSPRFAMIGRFAAAPRPAPLSPTTRVWDSVAVIPLAAEPKRVPVKATPVAAPPDPVREPDPDPEPLSRLESFNAPREDSIQVRILRELFERLPGPGVEILRGGEPRPISEAGLVGELERAADSMVQAASPGAIARAALDCAARGLRRCILLAVHNLQARLWDWRGVRLDTDAVTALRFPVDASGIFELVAGSDWYRGEIPQRPSQVQFYRDLKLPVPTEALLVPVYFDERLAAMLYGDGGEGAIVGESEIYVRLAGKMGLALNLLAMKRKLRQI